MKHKGSCHCGRIAFEVEGEIADVISCNCSMCERKGTLMWFVPRTALTLLTAPDRMSTYTFNKHVIKHRFCPSCGMHPYAEAVDPKGRPTAAVNLRCIEGIDLGSIAVKHFDGRSI